MFFVALVLHRNRLLLLKRACNQSKDAWELPSIEITQLENIVAIQRDFKSQSGLDIYPYLMVDSYQGRHANKKIILYKCSLLSGPAALSLSGDYSGYLWSYILKSAQLSFTPPHDDIINFLLHDPYAISRKTAGPHGSHKSGFASMDPDKRRRIQSFAGKRAHALGRAHRWTSDEARKASALAHPRSGRTRPVSSRTSPFRSQLLTLLQVCSTQHPGTPVSFVELGKELGISRQYARDLYYELKTEYPVPPVGKRRFSATHRHSDKT